MHQIGQMIAMGTRYLLGRHCTPACTAPTPVSRHCHASSSPQITHRDMPTAAISTPASSAGTGQTASGKCWLVGAGPGPADLLTVRAAELLQKAQVVVFDDLGAQASVSLYAGPDVDAVYVGKRGGRPSTKQPVINQLLVDHCRQGKQVVRLKGGCPSVFSRVSSEMTALAEAGCDFELVPGISSALAAPLFAGFPLTDAAISSSFVVVSGHDVEATHWAAFKSIPTLVILMAGRTLPAIVDKLLGCGWAPATPVSVIRAAGTAEQQVWHASLVAIGAEVEGKTLSPSTVVIGQIAAMAMSVQQSAMEV